MSSLKLMFSPLFIVIALVVPGTLGLRWHESVLRSQADQLNRTWQERVDGVHKELTGISRLLEEKEGELASVTDQYRILIETYEELKREFAEQAIQRRIDAGRIEQLEGSVEATRQDLRAAEAAAATEKAGRQQLEEQLQQAGERDSARAVVETELRSLLQRRSEEIVQSNLDLAHSLMRQHTLESALFGVLGMLVLLSGLILYFRRRIAKVILILAGAEAAELAPSRTASLLADRSEAEEADHSPAPQQR